MPKMQHGFKFTIKGEVFIASRSSAGSHIIAAVEEAYEIRAKIQEMLFDLPGDFTCTLPRSVSRHEPDPVTEVDDEEKAPF